MGGWVKKKEKKVFQKNIYIFSYALKMSINGETCVCSPFQVIRHI